MPDTRKKRLQISSILNDQRTASLPGGPIALPRLSISEYGLPSTPRFDDKNSHFLPQQTPLLSGNPGPYYYQQSQPRQYAGYGDPFAYSSAFQPGQALSQSAASTLGQMPPISAFGNPFLPPDRTHPGFPEVIQPFLHSHPSHTGPQQKSRRFRRRYYQINRRYKCSFVGCTKSYGSLNHLNTHIVTKKHGPRKCKADFKDAETVDVAHLSPESHNGSSWRDSHDDLPPLEHHTEFERNRKTGSLPLSDSSEKLPATIEHSGNSSGSYEAGSTHSHLQQNYSTNWGSRWSGIEPVLPPISSSHKESTTLPSIPSIVGERV